MENGLEAIAWELEEKGYTYAEIASHCIFYDMESFTDAMLDIWINKV